LTVVPLDRDLAERLAAIPASAGVAQILGPSGQNLLIGRAANLRRWAALHLGAGPPPAKGKRPPTNLRPVASGVAHAPTASPFQQKLVFERLMARHVPLAQRRDLKPPAFLHLDPAERFPRVSVRRREDGVPGLYGPFRDRKAAERARDALHKLVPLRPCDYTFEPDPALPLGLGCLFAQVRSCAAPCLARITEGDYQTMAAETAGRLARPDPSLSWLPLWVTAVDGGRGVVLDSSRGRVGLYPVVHGRVLEAAAVEASSAELEQAAARLSWDTSIPASEADWPWLLPWLQSPRGRGSYIRVDEPHDHRAIVAQLREVIPLAVAGSSRGGA
jgi:hypothetical protein